MVKRVLGNPLLTKRFDHSRRGGGRQDERAQHCIERICEVKEQHGATLAPERSIPKEGPDDVPRKVWPFARSTAEL
eukprot:3257861-Alexandrium_andersonii.AAC.1